jgi:hypothetical protein
VNREEEDTTGVWRVGRSHDGRLPVEQVIADWTSRTGRWGISVVVVSTVCSYNLRGLMVCRCGAWFVVRGVYMCMYMYMSERGYIQKGIHVGNHRGIKVCQDLKSPPGQNIKK